MAILDQFGRPIDTSAIRQPQTREDVAMTAALESEFDAHPARGLTPQRINAIMLAAEQGDLIRQLELADDMEERDGQIFSELDKRKRALLTLDWDVLPPEDASAAEKAQADQVKDWLRSIPNFKRRVIHNMSDGILKGFAALEMWWELDQRVLQPRLEFRPQRWMTLNRERTHLTLRSHSDQYGVPLRPYNWVLHMHPARNGYVARQALSRVLMLPYPDDVWRIDRKAHQDAEFCEYELGGPIDVADAKLPGRALIARICGWQYRSAECGYSGGAVAKADDTTTVVLSDDKCGHRLASCRLRFPGQELPFGGFPGCGQIRNV